MSPSKLRPAFKKTTRFAQYERAKKARTAVLNLRERIPWVLGPNTYIYATVAANGGILRQTDIVLSLGASAARIENYNTQYGNLLRTFQLQTSRAGGRAGSPSCSTSGFRSTGKSSP